MVERRRLLSRALLAVVLATPAVARASGTSGDDAETVGPRLDLPTLTATILRANGRRGVLTVQASLFAEQPDLARKAALSRPRLMDAYVAALQAWASRLPPGVAPNVEVLSKLLQRETDRVIGKGARVLLGGVMLT